MKIQSIILSSLLLAGGAFADEDSSHKVIAIQQASIQQILETMKVMQAEIDSLKQENSDLSAQIEANSQGITGNKTTLTSHGTSISSHGRTLTSHGNSISSNSTNIGKKVDKAVSGNNCLKGGSYSLCMQNDGNLVIYNGGAKWSSFDTIRNSGGNVTIRAGSCTWALQNDGNFVRYGCGPTTSWK